MIVLKRAMEFLCLIAALGLVAFLQLKEPQKPTLDSVTFAFNEGRYTLSPEVARLASFGYGHALSSLLWVRFLQETPPEKAPKGGGNWIYQDLNTITTLDPDYTEAFSEGALFLSVITEDTAGAEQLLRRGTLLHPDSALILGAMAYHYHFEMNDPDRAGPYYLALTKLADVPYLYSLMAASYLKRRGDPRAGVDLLKSMLEGTKDPKVREKIEAKIHKLEQGGKTP